MFFSMLFNQDALNFVCMIELFQNLMCFLWQWIKTMPSIHGMGSSLQVGYLEKNILQMCYKQHSAVQATRQILKHLVTAYRRRFGFLSFTIFNALRLVFECVSFFLPSVLDTCSAYNKVIVVSCLKLSLCLAVRNWFFRSSCFGYNTLARIKTHITNFIGMRLFCVVNLYDVLRRARHGCSE